MFYVVRKGESLGMYHASFPNLTAAQEYAQSLRASFNRQYEVVKVETVWTTTTLHDLLEEDRAAVLDRNIP